MKRGIKILLEPNINKYDRLTIKKGKEIKFGDFGKKYNDKFYSTISMLNKD